MNKPEKCLHVGFLKRFSFKYLHLNIGKNPEE
jgi:hypothetical protein